MRLAVLKVSLVGSDVYGKVAVDPSRTLWDLHLIIQDLIGWSGKHMHEFVIGDRIARIRRDLFPDFEEISETETRIHDVLKRPGDTILYVYDFSSEWVHSVELLGFLDSDSNDTIFIEKRGSISSECGDL